MPTVLAASPPFAGLGVLELGTNAELAVVPDVSLRIRNYQSKAFSERTGILYIFKIFKIVFTVLAASPPFAGLGVLELGTNAELAVVPDVSLRIRNCQSKAFSERTGILYIFKIFKIVFKIYCTDMQIVDNTVPVTGARINDKPKTL